MNGFTRTPGRIGARRLLWLGPIVLGLGLSGSESSGSGGDPPHTTTRRRSIPATYQTWSEYLMGGPSVWSSVAHPGLERRRSRRRCGRASGPTRRPNTSPVVNFFLYKQSLDPARFDHYHPTARQGPGQDRGRSSSDPDDDDNARRPISRRQITPASSPPSTVPEPATFLLAIGMTGYALWWRRRHVAESVRDMIGCVDWHRHRDRCRVFPRRGN